MMNVYAVKDTKSQLFNNPFVQKTDGTAIRTFSAACEDPKTELNKYPSDFSLYNLGEYDPESGKIIQKDIIQICNASEFVTVSPERVAEAAQEIRETHLEQ